MSEEGSDSMKLPPLFPEGHAIEEVQKALDEVLPQEPREIDFPAPLFSAEAQDGAQRAYKRFKTGGYGTQEKAKLIDTSKEF
jgi:hypothetical protein